MALNKIGPLRQIYKGKNFFLSLNKIDLPRQICLKVIKLKVNKLTLRFKKIFYSNKIILLGKFEKLNNVLIFKIMKFYLPRQILFKIIKL